jgi:protein TonB
MFKKKIKPIVVFLSLSLLAHFGFVISLWISSSPSTPQTDNVEVSFLDPSQLREMMNRQIVEQKERLNDEVDEKAKYLSAFDQKVLEETQAQKSGQFQNTAGGGKTPKAHKKIEAGELPSLKKLTPSFQSANDSKIEGNGPTDLAASQTDDHLKGLAPGLQTLLSTREFVYYSYYSRIKEQIRQHWEPGVREKVKILYKEGRTIASARDRVTQILVILNNKGELLKVQILSASGVVDLDQAAVEAFEAAAPFPNPPKGMVEKDGTIHIRWDFVLEA